MIFDVGQNDRFVKTVTLNPAISRFSLLAHHLQTYYGTAHESRVYFENKKNLSRDPNIMENAPMKNNLLLVLFCLAVFTPTLFAQNAVKLFDAKVIDQADSAAPNTFETAAAFGTTEIYLSCPLDAQSTISGPGGGNFSVDNFLTVNGTNICSGAGGTSCFSSTLNDPMQFLGEIMEVSYLGVAPIDVSSQITTSGNYTFSIKDYGYTFGNTEIYLNTTCSFVSQVCHRDNGRRVQKTLTIGGSAVAAHLGHGDTEGPCAQ
jgi:hypothetical protein